MLMQDYTVIEETLISTLNGDCNCRSTTSLCYEDHDFHWVIIHCRPAMLIISDFGRLFFLLLEANASSPFPALSQHVSRNLSAQPLPPFWLEYRLLVDTSSLLPGVLENRKRRSTQILTLGHFPEKSHVLTEPEDSVTPTMISIPSGTTASSFFSMVTAKMQPLWAARNDFRVDNGTSVELSDGEVLAVRVGELRVTGGQGAGKVRGVIIELSMREDADEGDAIDVAAREVVLRAALETRFRGSGVNFSNAKLVSKLISNEPEGSRHAEMVALYSELMRVAAPVTQR